MHIQYKKESLLINQTFYADLMHWDFLLFLCFIENDDFSESHDLCKFGIGKKRKKLYSCSSNKGSHFGLKRVAKWLATCARKRVPILGSNHPGDV